MKNTPPPPKFTIHNSQFTNSKAQSTISKAHNTKILALIGVSLALNISALLLPFMWLRKGLSRVDYSLFNSVGLMWEKGLYVLAVLVVIFSIIFPFAKLAILAWISLGPKTDERRNRWLHRVEMLGKWSMLDAFLVSIILGLASQQFFVGAKPLLGLTAFSVAIILSMLAGELLSRDRRVEPEKPSDSYTASSRLRVVIFGLALLASLCFPFLQIQNWILANKSYSIISLVPTLFAQGAWLAALLVTIFLILAPVALWIISWLSAFRASSTLSPKLQEYWIPLIKRWSMLDVFALALSIFAIESDQLISSEIRLGALFLALMLALQYLAQTKLSVIRLKN